MSHIDDKDINLSKLKFSETKLYGRSSEVSQLLNVWEGLANERSRPIKRPPEMVIISGQSGAGKTTIANQLREPVKKEGGYFISGKFDQARFDQSQRIEPYTALIAAFSELSDIISNDIHALFRLKVGIQEAVGTQGKSLTDVIPSLRCIIKQGDVPLANVGPIQAENRFKYVLRNFVRVICRLHPMVLFLDDLQWADPASLEVIQTLLTDKENSSFIFIGSFRSNEIGPDHPLALKLESLEQENVISTNIEVGNLSAEAVNCMVSDLLAEPAYTTNSLAETVYNKTHGNAFYIIHFLRALYDEGILSYNIVLMRWQWNLERIRSMNITENVVDLLKNKLKDLPSDVREAMKVAACLGSFFKISVLKTLLTYVDEINKEYELYRQNDDGKNGYFRNRLESILEIAIKEGLIEKDDAFTYKFAHDQVQLATFLLIPENERGDYKQRIALILLKELAAEEVEKNIFVVTDLLNSKGVMNCGTMEKIRLATLNYKAGKKAISSLAFAPCIQYAKTGIALLGKSHWKEHYGMSLQLHSMAAEALYCIGNVTEAIHIIDLILRNAKSFDDKYYPHIIYINLLTSQGKVTKAIQIGLRVLKRKGISFHNFRKINSNVGISAAFMKTKRLLEKRSSSDLSSLPIMEDKDKIKTMRLLDLLITCTYQSRQDLLPLFVFKMVRWSIRYGVCSFSPLAFSMYGVVLCIQGDCKGGYEMGQIALLLRDKLRADEIAGRLYTMVFGYINCWTNPAPLSMRPLVHGYQQGMAMGDIRNAMICIFNYAEYAFYSGYSLTLLEKDLKKFCHQMKQYNQLLILNYQLLCYQMVLNLLGMSDNPVELIGTAMDQERMLKEAKQQKNIIMINAIQARRMILLYYFCKYEDAGKIRLKSKSLKQCGHFVLVHTFFKGLTAIAMAKKERDKSWKRRMDMSLKKMKGWAKEGNVNCAHMISLLEAELFHFQGQMSRAESKYKSSITQARKCGFIHDRALATERLGLFFLDTEEMDWATHYLSEAYTLWLEWGAYSKAKYLSELYPKLVIPDERTEDNQNRTLLTRASELIVAGPLGNDR